MKKQKYSPVKRIRVSDEIWEKFVGQKPKDLKWEEYIEQITKRNEREA